MDSPTETGIEIPDGSSSFEEIPAVSDHSGSSSPVTPKAERLPVSLTFGSGGSFDDATPNHEDSDSFFSELDSEAEAFYSSLNHRLVSPGFMDGHEFSDKQMSCRELMKKFAQCEEELRTASLKLQDAEQEVERLKCEAAENLRAELETARREIETKDADVETEKRRALELQRHVPQGETRHVNGEKDGVCAEVDSLKAEMRARDVDFKQMEEQLNQLVSESGNGKSTVEELSARVKELEKQAEIQRKCIIRRRGR
ncbi:hypothetical protein F2Q69_00045552 [Brassica cretica]|uniref:Uncharacterized protein n=1 Tax=Brassica cretica TaxID=69181 RepID=A0A8S9ND97_BRACR|nr:hypothetical protein F2Q69_00045552 [Brassica cretica]